MIRGIHHVAVSVRDIDRMIRFYREAFGFELVGEEFAWDNEPLMDRIVDVSGTKARGAMLRSGTVYFELFEYSRPETDSPQPKRPQDRGYTHFSIDTDDIEADLPRLKAAGMTFNDRDAVDMGVAKTLYGYDPEGNIIEVQQCMPGSGLLLEDLPHVSPTSAAAG